MPKERDDVSASADRADSLLVDRFLSGDEEALAELCRRHLQPLHRVINAHLDPQVARRVSPSDLIQETWILAVKKLKMRDENPQIAVFPWLRQIAKECVIGAHRKHRHADRRNVYREQPLDLSDASVSNLVDRLIDLQASPSKIFQREEQRRLVRVAIENLKPEFREILVLRFLERHELRRCAEILGISPEGAKSRQRRALAAFADTIDASVQD